MPFFVLPAPPKKSQACGFGGFQTHGSHMSRGTDCWRESPSPKGRRQPPEWGVLGAQTGPHGTDTASPAGQATGLLRLQTGSPTTEKDAARCQQERILRNPSAAGPTLTLCRHRSGASHARPRQAEHAPSFSLEPQSERPSSVQSI